MTHQYLKISLAVWMSSLLTPLLCLAATERDADNDGITDQNEVVLGTDSKYAEPLTLIYEDGAKGEGDKSCGRALSPSRDATKIWFAPVARGRYLWRVDFVEPFELKPKNFCLLYLDSDDDRATGRQDKEFARGVDVMFDPAHLSLVGFPPQFKAGWSSVVQGRSVYLVADLPLNQKDGKSVYRLYLLCCTHEKGKEQDSDRTPWLDVVAPGESDREPKPWAYGENQNVVNWHMTRRGVRDLARDPANAAISPKACRMKGFTPDERVDEVSGGRYRDDSLSFACPKPGRYHVAWVMMNYQGQAQLHAIYVDGEQKGSAVCHELGRGQQFFALTEPLALTGKETIEIRALRSGSFRFRNILLLKALPEKPKLRIANLSAATVPRPDGSNDGRVTWITNWASASEVEYGTPPAYGRRVANDKFINNHRVFLEGIELGKTYHYRVTVRTHKGEVLASRDQTFLAQTPPAPAGKIAEAELPLSIRTTVKTGQVELFVSSGIPFPQGHFAQAKSVRLLDPEGREAPLQAQVLARWPDRTVKWLHVVFPATVSSSDARPFTLQYGTEIKPSPVKQKLEVAETEGGVSIVTGPLQLKLSKTRFAPPGQVWLDMNADGEFAPSERLTKGTPDCAVVLRDEQGKRFTTLSAPDEIVVEERGPLRAAVKVSGHHVAEDGSKLFAYTARVYAYAGKPYVRVFYTFGNDRLDAMFTQIKGLTLSTGLRLGEGAACTFGGQPSEQVGAGDKLDLYQDYENHFRRTQKGKVIGEGERAAGWVRLSDGKRGATVSVRNFWQLYPKAFSVSPDRIEVGLLPSLAADQYAKDKDLEDRLFYYLLNGVYKFRRGFEKRHELLYHFHDADSAEAEGVAGLFQHPVTAVAPLEWNCSTMAFGRVTPVRTDEFPWFERRFEVGLKRVFETRRKRFREYGMMNFGDWYGERGYNWGNMEYDTPFVLLAQFLRRGDPYLLELGEQATRHNIDVDTVHYHSDPDYVGAVYAHCIGHTGYYYPSGFKPPATPRGGCSPGHMWNRGSFLYHFLTGDPRAREIAEQVSSHNAEYRTRNYTIANHASRDHSWPMLTCMTAFDATHDPLYLNGARIIAGKIVEGQDPQTGCWLYPAGYSKVMPQKLGGYTWCVGLLLMSLDWYRQHIDDPAEIEAVETCMKRAADWMITNEWVKDAEGFRSTSCPSFDRHTRPGHSAWGASPGLTAVAKMTGDRKYLDYALRAYRHTLNTTDSMGKGFGINLAMVMHMIYDLKQMGITRFRDEAEPVKASAPPRLIFVEGEPIQVPVYLTSQSFKPVTGQVGLAVRQKGRRTEKARQSFVLERFGTSKELRFTLRPPAKLVAFEVEVPGQKETLEVAISSVSEEPRGNKVGLIAGQDDFLGPALEKAGVAFERITDVAEDLSPYRVMFLGTQAHTLNAAGVSSKYWRLWQYVKEGGLLVVSQMNDDEWQPHYLPGGIRLGEDNSTSGKIVKPESPLFTTPYRLSDVAGAMMYDHIQSCGPEWQELLEDAEGLPAVMEGTFGHGRIIVFEPSFERYFSGAEVEGRQSKKQFGLLFENLVAYVLK